ncbi:MAG: M56 family metallopeptidase [Vulcanimicrobiota bacterium]
MSDFLIIFFKKAAYLNLNLMIAVALASAIIWIFRVKNPKVCYIIWGLVVMRFLFNLLLYPENSTVRAVDIPFLTGHTPEHHYGLLSIGLAFSSDASELFKMLVTSVWLYDIKYTVGDIAATLLGAEITLYLGFVMFAFGIYALCRRLLHYFSFQSELRKSLAPCHFPGEEGIFTSDHIATPLVLGLIKPIVVLPLSFTCLVSREELQAVIHHERIHISRRDHIIFAVLSMLEAFFISVLPLRTAIRRLEESEEHICDRMVITAGKRSSDVAHALLKLAEFQTALKEMRSAFRLIQAVPGFIREKETIEQRLKIIFSIEKPCGSRVLQILKGALLYSLCFLFIFGCSVL